MGESLKETIARSNELAYTCLEQIAQAGCDRDAIHALLKAYIGYKFLLADDEMGSEDIAALSKASVDKLLANHRKEALQKGLGIRFDARASGAVKTIDDLAREVCARICDR